MHARILSPVLFKLTTLAIASIATISLCADASGQGSAGYYTNPETGIVYRKVTQTVERPVVETRISQRQQTVYRPQTVTETTPHSRTVYTPVVEYQWEPRVRGRWNPFRQTTVEYQHVSRTHWERSEEVVERTNTRTEWVAEHRTFEVPQQVVRMEREETTNYQVVGRVPTPQTNPSGVSTAIASRLRPLNAGSTIGPVNGPVNGSAQIASSNNGRNKIQGGMRPNDLYPNAAPLPGSGSTNGGVGIANTPSPTIFR
jgi:hypothetical protein